ncbi:hypothetical protein Len3610_03310 [Lentibacillus sp. CBA3610]|nr:hypothetical protein Len3610_03310 [Lentibacillus sp. CBA3610]
MAEVVTKSAEINKKSADTVTNPAEVHNFQAEIVINSHQTQNDQGKNLIVLAPARFPAFIIIYFPIQPAGKLILYLF